MVDFFLILPGLGIVLANWGTCAIESMILQNSLSIVNIKQYICLKSLSLLISLNCSVSSVTNFHPAGVCYATV